MRDRLHMESSRACPVGVVLEAAIGIGAALFAEGDRGSGGIHIVIERPATREDDGGLDDEIVAVEREIGIVAAEFLGGAGVAGFGEGDEFGHGGGGIGDWGLAEGDGTRIAKRTNRLPDAVIGRAVSR